MPLNVECFLILVKRQSKNTLLSIIKEYIWLGRALWAICGRLIIDYKTRALFTQRLIIPSISQTQTQDLYTENRKHMVDSKTKFTYTPYKRSKDHNGSYLTEWPWRRNYNNCDSFSKSIEHIAEIYPVNNYNNN